MSKTITSEQGAKMENTKKIQSEVPEGFVFLHQVDSRFHIHMRYATTDNFLGCVVDGYHPTAQCIATYQGVEALKKAHDIFMTDGYEIVVYDAFRPQIAVDHFYRWSLDNSDQKVKEYYYPRHDKKDLFDIGYIARRSAHTRGSTFDFSLIEKGKKLSAIQPILRTLEDGTDVWFLDDNTLDMGTSFDMLDEVSHHDCLIISKEQLDRRNYLRDVMVRSGFKPYSKEWWHYTLINEPFPA